MLTLRCFLAGFVLALALPPAIGQSKALSTQTTTNEISDIQRKSLEELANDLPQLKKYREANAALPVIKKGENRIVFFGDSLTEGWGMARNGSVFFPGKPNYLNRGISGQTTIQMLVRFRQDVIDLHPAVVLILAGTNDFAGNLGPSSVQMVADNIRSMAELARANGIRVVLCSVLPAAGYRWRADVHPVGPTRELNRWLKNYAQAQNTVYVDYYSALASEDGAMKDGLSWDGVHPTAAGYRIMAPLAEAGIQAALRR